MKTYLALGLLTTLLLTSCSMDWNDAKTTQNDLFKKKQECVEYENDIKKTIGSDNILVEIFYSKDRNSCMYTMSKIKENEMVLVDYLTKEEIRWTRLHPQENGLDSYQKSSKEFQDKIKELKGE